MGSGEKGSSEGNEVKSSSEMPVKVSKLGQNFLRGFTFFVLEFFFFFYFYPYFPFARTMVLSFLIGLGKKDIRFWAPINSSNTAFISVRKKSKEDNVWISVTGTHIVPVSDAFFCVIAMAVLSHIFKEPFTITSLSSGWPLLEKVLRFFLLINFFPQSFCFLFPIFLFL